MSARTREWIKCPICGAPDTRKETDGEGNTLIFCVNHACRSNNPDGHDIAAPNNGRKDSALMVNAEMIAGRVAETWYEKREQKFRALRRDITAAIREGIELEIQPERDKRKEMARDFETAFRAVREENDRLRARIAELEKA